VPELAAIIALWAFALIHSLWILRVFFHRIYYAWFLVFPLLVFFDGVPSTGLGDHACHIGDIHCVQLVLEFCRHLIPDLVEH
jgi:hypothetical protein